MVTLAYEMEIAYRQQQVARDVRQARRVAPAARRVQQGGRRRGLLSLHLPALHRAGGV